MQRVPDVGFGLSYKLGNESGIFGIEGKMVCGCVLCVGVASGECLPSGDGERFFIPVHRIGWDCIG